MLFFSDCCIDHVYVVRFELEKKCLSIVVLGTYVLLSE